MKRKPLINSALATKLPRKGGIYHPKEQKSNIQQISAFRAIPAEKTHVKLRRNCE